MNELVARLNMLARGLFKCQVSLQSIDQLSGVDWAAEELEFIQTNPSEAPVFINSLIAGTFGVPIRAKGELMGVAVVSGWEETDTQKTTRLAEVINLVLEQAFENHQRIEVLKEIEERLAVLQNIEGGGNVIPFHPARPLVSEDDDMMTSPAKSSHPMFNRIPLLIRTEQAFPVNQLAVEIHGLSSKWAFVPVEEFPAEVFADPAHFRELGSMTIFIKDLSALSIEQQRELALCLDEATEESPHVVAFITDSLRTLEQEKKVLPFLARKFAFARLHATEGDADIIALALTSLLQQMNSSPEIDPNSAPLLPFNVSLFNPQQPNFH